MERHWKAYRPLPFTVYNDAYIIIQKKKKKYREQLVSEPEISNSNFAL